MTLFIYSHRPRLLVSDLKMSSPNQLAKKCLKKLSIAEGGAATATTTATLGVAAKKMEDFSSWYTQVLLRAEVMDYYDISGCYIIRPWGFQIWKKIKEFLGGKFEELGVDDAYFPLFIPQSTLMKEKDHIEGFAPEVAWVTKAGSTDLQDPIAVRPTSETIMYPAFSKWIQSHRDLPMKMNQWCNVVRWEFKHPQPFLRSREFLWQEGHSCFMSKQEADAEVLQMLDLYHRCYEDVLAVPVIRGKKSESEKFAGALYTTTVEGFIPAVGRGIQGATSHCLGQNFSKMFSIQVQADDADSTPSYVWQNSWGYTTRSIGVCIMVHGDDVGLILPPKVASCQVIIVPVGINKKLSSEKKEALYAAVDSLKDSLCAHGIRAKVDRRENYSPGWKFNHWELKGVPLRIEVGPKELEADCGVRVTIRYTGEKRDGVAIKLSSGGVGGEDAAATSSLKENYSIINNILEEVQLGMLKKAKEERDRHLKVVKSFDNFTKVLDEKCIILSPWCMESSCEDKIKERSKVRVFSAAAAGAGEDSKGEEDSRAPSMGAKSLCLPFEADLRSLPSMAGEHIEPERNACVQCGKEAKAWGLWGRSY